MVVEIATSLTFITRRCASRRTCAAPGPSNTGEPKSTNIAMGSLNLPPEDTLVEPGTGS
jgi:hypothetical protein